MGVPDPARSRAVLIGVDGYDHLDDLPAVGNNVRRLAELLTDHDLWGLPAERCVVLHNPSTTDAVLNAVHEAAGAAEDAFVLYFAGHGLVSPVGEVDLHLALPDWDDNRSYRSVAYSALRHALVDTCTAYARVALLDCCYSGIVLKGYMSPPNMADLAAVDGTYVMTASSETQLARAPEGGRNSPPLRASW
ncbi:caspase family protein [Streptomyces sp. GESEQ-35]|uniref:caspase family protein n=1 Tax=Streptomyces sp. GESEQ-35 TaxID=2812657 RepID=UPI001B3267A9|nr:caspase family protein [Streptomyces sp. GESEQ-35]